MKYLKYLLLIIFIIFLNSVTTIKVYAAQIKEANFCEKDKGSVSVGGGCSVATSNFSKNSVSTCHYSERMVSIPSKCTTVEEEVSNGVKYYVFAIIDNSGSMDRDAVGVTKNKKDILNDEFKKMAADVFKANGKIKYTLMSKNSFKEYKSGDVLNDNLTNGSTPTQYAYQNVYAQLTSKKIQQEIKNGGYTPMIVLFTDGYPNKAITKYEADIDKDSKQTSTDKRDFGHIFSSKIFYYTLLTMRDLKNKVTNIYKDTGVKFYTFGVGMDSNDILAKYLINPSQENYNNLSNGTVSTEAQKLKEVIDNPTKSYQEFTAKISKIGDNGINADFPEYGLFNGSLSTNSKIVTFNFDGKITSSFVSQLKGKNKILSFNFPTNKSRSNFEAAISKIEYCYGNDCIELDKNYFSFETNSTYYPNFVIAKLNSDKEKIITNNLTKIKFTFNKKYSFNTFKFKENLKASDFYNIVDGSYVGSNIEEFEKVLKDMTKTVKSSEKCTEPSEKPQTYCDYMYTKNTYSGSCGNKDINIKYYVKTSELLYEQYSSGSFNEKGTTCSPVNVNIPVVITEKTEFNPGSNWNNINIYNGGSFSIPEIKVTNQVEWIYGKTSTKDSAMFDLTYEYKRKNADGTYSNLDGLSDTDLTETKLYVDSGCKTVVSNFDDDINEVVESFISDNNYNELLKTTNISATDDEYVLVDNSRDKKVEGNKITIIDTITPVKAWADNEGNVRYSNDTQTYPYTFFGNVRFAPFKFIRGLPFKFQADYNLSVVKEIDVKLSSGVSCSVEVYGKIYIDDPNGKLKFNVVYRSIDVSNPFPKSVPNDWKIWWSNSSNKNRIYNTYQKYYSNTPLYQITLNSSNKKIFDANYNYSSWNGINSNGSSDFVNNNFNKKGSSTSYCSVGYWKEECDTR